MKKPVFREALLEVSGTDFHVLCALRLLSFHCLILLQIYRFLDELRVDCRIATNCLD